MDYNRTDVRTTEMKTPKEVDLHIHSLFSDGQCTIEQLVEKAFKKNLRAISITDHDTIEAYPHAQRIGKQLGIEVITGVEFSSQVYNTDVHILGYGFDTDDTRLIAMLKTIRKARIARAKEIIARLNNLGMDIRFETVLSISGQGAVGRPHIAHALIKEELVSCFRDAFENYLGLNCPGYVPKKTLSPAEIIDLIHRAGGLAVLAHPGITQIDEYIPQLIEFGLDGVEVLHPEHTAKDAKRYFEAARKYGLLYTGGSDFHLTGYGIHIGCPNVSYETVINLKTNRKEIVQ